MNSASRYAIETVEGLVTAYPQIYGRPAADTISAAVAEAVATFIGRPNKIGRARIFTKRGTGIPDRGMVAI